MLKPYRYFIVVFIVLISHLSKAQYFPSDNPVNYITQPDLNRPIDKTKPVYSIPAVADISGGVASYTIPINVPKGVNGIAPSISVAYNSGSGQGELGLNWHLQGKSAITLANDNHLMNGRVRPFEYYDEDNNLSLDGQLLVFTSGTKFFPGSTYRTLNESWQEVTALPVVNGQTPVPGFEVMSKDGTKRIYGQNPNYQFNLEDDNSGGVSVPWPFIWLLEKIVDRDGNEIRYHYLFNQTAREYLLDKITYTHSAENHSPQLPPTATIQFEYQNRVDVRDFWVLDNNLKNTVLLTGITTYNGQSEYSKYQFNYTFETDGVKASDHSRLVEVKYWALQEEVISTLIQWHEPAEYEATYSNQLNFGNLKHTPLGQGMNLCKSIADQRINADLNGDGYEDILFLEHSAINTGDCHVFGGGTVTTYDHQFEVYAQINNGSGTTFSRSNLVPAYVSNWKPGECGRKPYSNIHLGDFNGDGLNDFLVQRCIINGENKWYIDVYLNDANSPGTFTLSRSDHVTWTLPFGYDDSDDEQKNAKYEIGSPENIPFRLLVADFDADGITDYSHMASIVMGGNPNYTRTPTWRVTYFNPDGSQQIENLLWTGEGLGPVDSALFGDFNGDGKTDLLLLGRLDCDIITTYGRSNIEKLFPPNSFPTSYHHVQVADFNGDGKSDILTYLPNPTPSNPNKWLINYSKGDDWDHPAQVLDGFINESLNFVMDGNRPRFPIEPNILRIADFDFDGRADLMFVRESNGVFDAKVYYNKINSQSSWPWKVYDIDPADLFPLSGLPTFLGSPCALRVLRQQDLSLVNLTGKKAVQLLYMWGANSNGGTLYKFTLTFKKDSKTDKVRQVLDGFNRLTQFDYAYLTEGSVYQRDEFPQYPTTTIAGPISVASRIRQWDFQGNIFLDQQYSYKNLMVNKLGLGMLGYKTIEATDNLNNAKSITESQLVKPGSAQLYSSWPLLPSAITKKVASTDELISEEKFTYFSGDILLNYPSGKTTFNAKLKRHTRQNFLLETSEDKNLTYDVNNNILTSVTYTYDNSLFQAPWLEREVTSYQNYVSNGSFVPWLWQNKQTTLSRNGEPNVVLKETQIYYPNGNLDKHISNPNTTAQIETKYVYHYMGCLDEKRVKPVGLPLRTTTTNWSGDWRLVESMENPMGWISSYQYHNILDLVTKETDPNGFETDKVYDNFGRLTRTTDVSLQLNDDILIAWNTDPNYAEALYKIETNGDNQALSSKWYDGVERHIKSMHLDQNDEPVHVLKEYFSNGLLQRKSAPHFSLQTQYWTDYQYDDYQRLTTITSPVATVQTSYSGRSTTVANLTSGETKTTLKDASGKTVSITDHGGTVNYYYTAHGKNREISGVGTSITSVFDDYGRQLELQDPAAGTMLYTYDALGRVVTQTDAKNQVYTISYDNMDRIISKTGPEGGYEFSFDSQFVGLPDSEDSPYGPSKSYIYDTEGRLIEVTEEIDGQNYTLAYTYDVDGNISTMTYPNGLELSYLYDSYGYLTEIKDFQSQQVLWKYKDVNHFGQIINYSLNGTDHERLYDLVSGLPTREAGDWWQRDYSFENGSGNLERRKNTPASLQEDFAYNDGPTRLTAYNVGTSVNTVSYEADGGIKFKTDVGDYTNDGISKQTELIVNNPGTISSDHQLITYTPFNSTATLSEGNFDASFTYGSDQQRKMMTILESGSDYIERIYVGNGLYERDFRNNLERNYSYISTPGGTEIIYVEDEQTNTGEYYFVHTDYLGSFLVLADESGKIVEEHHYDPWGNAKNPQDWKNKASGDPDLNILYRGFTGHEHLWCFGLVNMNGRLYDPLLGRMLSPDNHVQNPEYSQNLNRYTYAYNNPLKYTDPDGESVVMAMLIGAFVNVAIQGVSGNIDYGNPWQVLGSLGVGAASGAAGYWAGGAIASMFSGGAAGFYAGATVGASAGAAGGFVGGAGNAWLGGANFAQGIVKGINSAGAGLLSGGLLGGIFSGIAARDMGRNFWTGKKPYYQVELRGYEGVPQVDAENCKNSTLEAIEKMNGGTRTQADFKKAGDMYLATNPNASLEDYFEFFGFRIKDPSSWGTGYEGVGSSLNAGHPIVINQGVTDRSTHTLTIVKIRQWNKGGKVSVWFSDPLELKPWRANFNILGNSDFNKGAYLFWLPK